MRKKSKAIIQTIKRIGTEKNYYGKNLYPNYEVKTDFYFFKFKIWIFGNKARIKCLKCKKEKIIDGETKFKFEKREPDILEYSDPELQKSIFGKIVRFEIGHLLHEHEIPVDHFGKNYIHYCLDLFFEYRKLKETKLEQDKRLEKLWKGIFKNLACYKCGSVIMSGGDDGICCTGKPPKGHPYITKQELEIFPGW